MHTHTQSDMGHFTVSNVDANPFSYPHPTRRLSPPWTVCQIQTKVFVLYARRIWKHNMTPAIQHMWDCAWSWIASWQDNSNGHGSAFLNNKHGTHTQTPITEIESCHINFLPRKLLMAQGRWETGEEGHKLWLLCFWLVPLIWTLSVTHSARCP